MIIKKVLEIAFIDLQLILNKNLSSLFSKFEIQSADMKSIKKCPKCLKQPTYINSGIIEMPMVPNIKRVIVLLFRIKIEIKKITIEIK